MKTFGNFGLDLKLVHKSGNCCGCHLFGCLSKLLSLETVLTEPRLHVRPRQAARSLLENQ
jgi:hypothetical protein